MGDPNKALLKKAILEKAEIRFDLDSPLIREARIRRMSECGRCGWDSEGRWSPCALHSKFKV